MSRLTPWPPTDGPSHDGRSTTSSTYTSTSQSPSVAGSASYTTTGSSGRSGGPSTSDSWTICSCCRCAIRPTRGGVDTTTSSSYTSNYTSSYTASGSGASSSGASTTSTLCLGCRLAAEKMQDAWGGGPSGGGINPLRRRAAPGGNRVLLNETETTGPEGPSAAKQPDFPIAPVGDAATDAGSGQVPSTIRVVGGPKARPRPGNLGASYLSGLEWGEDDAFVFEEDAAAVDGAANVSIQCGAPTPMPRDGEAQTAPRAATRDCGAQHVVAEWTADAQTCTEPSVEEAAAQTDAGPRTVEAVEANSTIDAFATACLATLEDAESRARTVLLDTEVTARDAFAGRVRHTLGIALLLATSASTAAAAAAETARACADAARLAARTEALEATLCAVQLHRCWDEAARAAAAIAAEEAAARGDVAAARVAEAAMEVAASLRRRLAEAEAALARAHQDAAAQEQRLTECAVREGELRVKLRHALYLQAASNAAAPGGARGLASTLAPSVDSAMPIVVRFARAHALAARAVDLEREALSAGDTRAEGPSCAADAI